MNMSVSKLPLEDKILICVDCDSKFTFTVGEQRYFLSKGLFEPKRCPNCRKKRRETLMTRGDSENV